MGDEKNVFLRIVHEDNENQDDAINVDLSLIWKRLKRYAVLWLCLAVGLGSLSLSLARFARRSWSAEEVKALIHLASTSYDIAKIKSPGVIEDALNRVGLDAESLEQVRNAVTVQGVIPESAYERMSLYYQHITQNSAAADMIAKLLDTNYDVSDYIIVLSCSDAGIDREQGLLLLNALLDAYRDYCASVYSPNTALQNPLSAIDYRDYDYAEVANIFSNALDSVSSYLSQFQGKRMAGEYRSVNTGLTFSDLSKTASSLREIDLDRAASYITIHSVSSNDAASQVSHYEWLIENLEQQRAVQRTHLAALTDSINSYEKDSVIILSGQDGAIVTQQDNLNANYDAMIQENLDTQSLIASYNRSISYYRSVIEGFRRATGTEGETFVSDPKDVAVVEEYLKNLYEDLMELSQNVTLTANEYYEKVSFADQIRVQIPPIVDITSSVSPLKIALAVEAALFFVYFAAAVILGARDANPPKRRAAGELVESR